MHQSSYNKTLITEQLHCLVIGVKITETIMHFQTYTLVYMFYIFFLILRLFMLLLMPIQLRTSILNMGVFRLYNKQRK